MNSSDATSQLLKPGQIFAQKYRIKRYLAEGAMGAVFVAEHTTTEQEVAVKVLWLQSSKNNQKDQQNALLEAKIAARVRSENIVQVLDAGLDQGTGWLYIVMELLRGSTLEQLVHQQGRLSPPEVVTYLQQAASALDKAHQYTGEDGSPLPIIHRDLKPENIFVTARDSGEPLVKILDFGIAKVVSKEASKGSTNAKGTPLYMAPEQLALKPVGPGTDIWALGIITFYLLTGKSFWLAAHQSDATVFALFAEIGAPPSHSASQRAVALGVSPSWPPTFDAWLSTCLAPAIHNRFPSATAAVEALAASLGVVAPSSRSGSGLVSAPFSASAPLSAPAQPPAPVQASRTVGETQNALSQTKPSATLPPSGGRGAMMALGGLGAFLIVAGGSVLLSRSGPKAEGLVPSAAQPASSPAASSAAPAASVLPVVEIAASASASSTARPLRPFNKTPPQPAGKPKSTFNPLND